MPPGLRKFALTAHIVSSVGWLGAVASFLTLAVAGLSTREPERARAAYVAMELTAWFVIVPLSLASPLTGFIQSFGTPWGLFQHYWIIAKQVITIPATVFLLLHTPAISRLADAAEDTALLSADFGRLKIQLTADAGAAQLVLIVATALSVYKPRGMTRYGQRKQRAQRAVDAPAPRRDG